MGSKIGSNPRTFYGFSSKKSVKHHIKLEQPRLFKCIGKIKKLDRNKLKGRLKDKKAHRYLVYFKESKC